MMEPSEGKPVPRVSGATAAFHARRFKEEHPDLYGAIERVVLDDAAQGRHTSISKAINIVRYSVKAEEEPRPVKINNTIAPALARMIALDNPWAAPYMDMRKSMSDGMVERCRARSN